MLRYCLTVFLFLLAAGFSTAARADSEARSAWPGASRAK